MASTTSFAAIITTLLDTDAYKLHMQQAVFHQQLNVPASYEFINRNNDDHLGKYADEIRQQIRAMATVSLSDDEYHYLQKLPYMEEEYLQYLRQYRFNPSQVEVLTCPTGSVSNNNKYNEDDTDLVLRVSGPWLETILWEVPLLAIISEVAQRHRHPTIGVDEAKSALFAKLDEFVSTNEGKDLSEFRVTDFGTRRRFSKAVQEEVVRILSTDPRFRAHFFGTSNYDLARRMNLTPVGTQAHEWFQAFQQLAPSLRESQTCALDTWIKEYPGQLGIALTDCITMDAFLKDFDARLANTFVGLRHDSGDPFTWGDKAIDHYNSLGIDPRTKTLVFSDGLNLQKAVELYLNFQERVRVMFGIGTSLTCAISGVKPMNIVIKMIRCQNSPVAKVSDAPGKNCCDDPDYVVVLKKTFMVS